ncbi:unnamed protein product [Amoebophrya sp. A120]|nr:unnamed protein product [Amoebophrya sp. A120]|eukprot:GSA120T00006884001.1
MSMLESCPFSVLSIAAVRRSVRILFFVAFSTTVVTPALKLPKGGGKGKTKSRLGGNKGHGKGGVPADDSHSRVFRVVPSGPRAGAGNGIAQQVPQSVVPSTTSQTTARSSGDAYRAAGNQYLEKAETVPGQLLGSNTKRAAGGPPAAKESSQQKPQSTSSSTTVPTSEIGALISNLWQRFSSSAQNKPTSNPQQPEADKNSYVAYQQNENKAFAINFLESQFCGTEWDLYRLVRPQPVTSPPDAGNEFVIKTVRDTGKPVSRNGEQAFENGLGRLQARRRVLQNEILGSPLAFQKSAREADEHEIIGKVIRKLVSVTLVRKLGQDGIVSSDREPGLLCGAPALGGKLEPCKAFLSRKDILKRFDQVYRSIFNTEAFRNQESGDFSVDEMKKTSSTTRLTPYGEEMLLHQMLLHQKSVFMKEEILPKLEKMMRKHQEDHFYGDDALRWLLERLQDQETWRNFSTNVADLQRGTIQNVLAVFKRAEQMEEFVPTVEEPCHIYSGREQLLSGLERAFGGKHPTTGNYWSETGGQVFDVVVKAFQDRAGNDLRKEHELARQEEEEQLREIRQMKTTKQAAAKGEARTQEGNEHFYSSASTTAEEEPVAPSLSGATPFSAGGAFRFPPRHEPRRPTPAGFSRPTSSPEVQSSSAAVPESTFVSASPAGWATTAMAASTAGHDHEDEAQELIKQPHDSCSRDTTTQKYYHTTCGFDVPELDVINLDGEGEADSCACEKPRQEGCGAAKTSTTAASYGRACDCCKNFAELSPDAANIPSPVQEFCVSTPEFRSSYSLATDLESALGLQWPHDHVNWPQRQRRPAGRM